MVSTNIRNPICALKAKSLVNECIRINMRKAVLLSALMFCVVLSPFVQASDTDNDGILDDTDLCMWAPGTANSTAGMGCPDRDGNGLADFEEEIRHNWLDSKEEKRINNDPLGDEAVALEWSLDGTVYYGGGQSDFVEMYDALGNYVSALYQMPGDIRDIERSPDGTMLAVASGGSGAVIINSTTGALVSNLVNNSNGSIQGSIYSIAWSNDQSRVFVHNGTSAITWFTTNNWSQERLIPNFPIFWGSSWMGGIDTTPDDSLVIFSAISEINAYWINNGTFAWKIDNHTEYIRALKVSPDGRYLASGSDSNNMLIHTLGTTPVLIKTLNIGSDVYEIDISKDGGTVFVASHSRTVKTFDSLSWNSLGNISGFNGSSNNNRGTESIAVSPDGERLVITHRRGNMSLYFAPDAYIRLHGEHYTSLLEDYWRLSYPSNTESARYWNFDRVTSTVDACDTKHYIGSSPIGVSPQYATKNSSYTTTGLWDCKNTDGQILEIPYGRAPGALMVKSGSTSETCIDTIGGLSMGQVRWIVSGSNKASLTGAGEMPGLVWSSVVPNDDSDGIVEWKDLDPSCPDTEIVLAHRWENRSDIRILEETVLCENCAFKDSIYTSSSARYRASNSEYESDVVGGVAGPSGAGSIGFTEMVYAVNNAHLVHIIPLVDNYTHGASDALLDGGVLVNATLNNSRSDDWPLQTNMRAFISTDSLASNLDFLKFLLTDVGQMRWEQAGFTGLNAWDLYQSWGKLGVNMIHLLPDADEDGVWDGEDLCPETMIGIVVNELGCAENQLDDDLDGFTNDLDDCDNVSGTSTLGSVGCPDSDGDQWADDFDSHPGDSSEWNDTDMDEFGDNSDDCIDTYGNSTEDLLGCVDSDGDGWSDSGDTFPDDPTEWIDTDTDGYGDNSDAFPNEISQWLDTDADGFGDNNTGLEGDDCVEVSGTSHEDGIFGCLDTDSDGWADSIDDLPSNPEQHRDEDGDGVGDDASVNDYDWCVETPADEISMVDSVGCGPSERDGDYDTFTDDMDQCPNTPISQSTQVNTTIYLDSERTEINPYVGCAPSEIDSDGDGISLDSDWDDNNPDQWFDSDGDGYGDNSDGLNGDDCPNDAGNSIYDKVGCYDLDGDGWSFDSDFNDGDPTQWNDTDEDGFGDNWDNPDWTESRTLGIYLEGATQPDRCPDEYSPYLYSEYQGCLTVISDSDEKEIIASDDETEDSNLIMIIAIAGTGVIFLLFGAIAMILKKKPAQNKRRPKKSAPQVKDDTEEVLQSMDSEKSDNFVSSWEELPDGDWMDTDENGVNWYQDTTGRYWYSDSGGFRVWDK